MLSRPSLLEHHVEALGGPHRVGGRVGQGDVEAPGVELEAPGLHGDTVVQGTDLNVALDELPREEGVTKANDVPNGLATVSDACLERTDLASVAAGSDLRQNEA